MATTKVVVAEAAASVEAADTGFKVALAAQVVSRR
jgi:hypothetical protein